MKTMLALLLLAVVAACGCGQGAEYYCPLKPGETAIYQISFKGSALEEALNGKLVVSTLPFRHLQGKDCLVVKYDFQGFPLSIPTEFQFVVSGPEGIYLFAEQSIEDPQPKLLDPPSFVLKNPVQPGTSWEEKYLPLLGEENRKVTLTSVIESVSETVTVPAGTYKNCVVVRSTLKGISLAKTSPSLQVEGLSWFAPGVGEVKFIFRERKSDPDSDEVEAVEFVGQLESLSR
uniref:Lipoprotein n=1 Tax=Desulfobacca acetoxidans TaxID=60893 RepID=A0A7V4G8W9_9BACT